MNNFKVMLLLVFTTGFSFIVAAAEKQEPAALNQPVTPDTNLSKNTFELHVVVDFGDDLLRSNGPFTEKILDEMMRTFKSWGIMCLSSVMGPW